MKFKIDYSNQYLVGGLVGVFTALSLIIVSCIEMLSIWWIIPAALMIIASVLLVNKLHEERLSEWYSSFAIGFLLVIVISLAAAACVALATEPASSNAELLY